MRSPLGALARAAAVPRLTDKSPVPYVSRRAAVAAGWNVPTGMEQQLRSMGGVGTLFAIVDRLANATAQVDWKLYRTAKSGNPEDRVEVTSHAAIDLWAKPNAFMTRQEFIESFQQHYDLTGEGWWLVGRDERLRAAGPMELWPVRPDRMEPEPDPEEFLTGYTYRGPDGERIPLGLDEVIQLRRPNPIDPYRGIGAVQTILADLEGVQLSAQWNRNFFANSAEPGGIVEIDRRLSDDEFDELTMRWREQHQGVANAHRVAILEQGKWVDRKYSMRDMQFTELRAVSREVIREAFGMPKFAVGDVEDINRATADASKAWFAEQLTVPRLERIKQALNNDLLPMFGATSRGLEFDYCDPVPADRDADNAELTTKANAAATLRAAGWYAPEILTAVGLPEITYGQPDADPQQALLVELVKGAPSLAPMILPMLGFDLPEQAPTGPPPPAPVPAPAARLAIPAPRAAEQTPDGVQLPDVAAVQDSWVRALEALLRQWGSIVADQIRALVAKVRALLEDGDVAGLSRLEAPTGDATDALHAALVALAQEAARQVVGEAAAQDVQIEAGDPDTSVLADVAAVTAALLAAELATSAGREALRVWSPGVPPAQVADAVTRHLSDLTDARERQWLGGALTSAQHEGRAATFQAFEDGGTGGGQGGEGLAAPSIAYYGQEILDKNTCRYCREIDGRFLGDTYAEARRDYPAGGYTRCEGGVRCRGMVVAVWRGGSDQSQWIEKEPVSTP